MSKSIVIPERSKDIGGMKEEISLSPIPKKDGAMGLFSRLLKSTVVGSLSNRSTPESPTTSEPPTTYYGVYIPCEIKKGPDEEAIHVYKKKSEALDLMKKYKLARFKAFQNYQEAVSFALRGIENVDTHEGNGNSLMGEKPYPFKAPSPQDMVALRKAIEAGLISTVRDRVWDNPRYMVSSGNTPAIMHEGCRYNALHVAAKAKNAEMCNMLLNIVGDPEFVQRLYGGDADDECCKEFAEILVDRYLNTPDKGQNETPLHFATKFGAEQVVEVLTSFPQCNVDAVNKYGQAPKDIICSRASAPSGEAVRQISTHLKSRYYVPVLHSTDDSAAPALGAVFTPRAEQDLNKDPLSPQYEIRAFAGPMEAAEAEAFRRRWKTPPRSQVKLQPPAFRLRDMSKGLERYGRTLAEELKVGWKEYWPFLDTFTDLRTAEGLQLLENYLKTKYDNACSFAYSDTCALSQSPEDFSISRISLNNSISTPTKDNTLSPMSELCVAMKTFSIGNDRPPHWRKTDPIRQRLCRQPTAKMTIPNGSPPSPTINHTVSQLLCIERTCQVFAKRIADALVFSLTSEPEVAGDSLKSEAKHLQHTIFTYMDDVRFKDINFSLTHSRLAQLVVFKLKQQTTDLDDINNLVHFLMKLRCPNDDIFSSDDEKKTYSRTSRIKVGNVIDSHVRCLASFISEELVEDICKGPSVSENGCTEIWDKTSKCACDWNLDFYERSSKKNASFRKNRSILSTSPKSDSFIKRLTFDHDIGDSARQAASEPRARRRHAGSGDALPAAAAPAAAAAAARYTVSMDKCTVVPAEISEDDSCNSDADSDAYLTASEHSDKSDGSDQSDGGDPDDMQDASDAAVAEPFIYGEEPSKMDRLVYDAVYSCAISSEEYPYIYRWRHCVGLYPPEQREKWPQAQITDEDSTYSPTSYSFSLGSTLANSSRKVRGSIIHSTDSCSTPKKGDVSCDSPSRNLSLQVSSWLRVTGPNSPKCASATKNVGHNVSFGF